ncbi:glutamine-hydrolyzing GMP synthase [Chitinophaga pendula]|uniref:glutamine-hydrolyzing GMP synthase n=1 Tax=Chitinophaga TaxID=79328 RepID=UPI000BAE9C76|nr:MULTISPECIES: glutamine-hydrolyzing GMP synthase [Chitinophaga]ASZ14581.1 glutamine-hydrolyzing GMP synthase [Chitinophaga sp. MD30]UCJ07767.1 glutamine-hydrolyzing GMP synthase [Chitinophaga pendula]
MTEKILILDFGSQYTQLIARSIRELNIYCEIKPCLQPIAWDESIKGIILSGSPFSVNDPTAPSVDIAAMAAHVPVLGVCYGAQLMAKNFGGEVAKSNIREYGRAFMEHSDREEPLLYDICEKSQVWMSHSDTIVRMPEGFDIISRTENIPVAAFRSTTLAAHPLLGLQFHPEVTHSLEGKQILRNFLVHLCKCSQDWTPAAFVQETVEKIKAQVGDKKVVMALSGGVDSTVAAELIHKAIGQNLYCVFVDNGLLRKHEFESVLESYKHMGLNVKGVNAKDMFYDELKGVSDPEQKRKIIGRLFIEVFQQESTQLQDISFLGQGTIYPDVIESVSVNGPSVTIKSHHNVGGLPEKMNMQLVEPLRFLFKDEVRRVGREIGISDIFLGRHPFPGPGLAIRILGDITPEKVAMLQEADAVYIDGLREHGLYDKVWQAGTILLPVQSVGVMGDERTYEFTVALRAVTSTDGMTADWAHLPYEFLAKISNDIINKVKGINRVVYDISSKPPATIEWE